MINSVSFDCNVILELPKSWFKIAIQADGKYVNLPTFQFPGEVKFLLHTNYDYKDVIIEK